MDKYFIQSMLEILAILFVIYAMVHEEQIAIWERKIARRFAIRLLKIIEGTEKQTAKIIQFRNNKESVWIQDRPE